MNNQIGQKKSQKCFIHQFCFGGYIGAQFGAPK